MSDRGHARELRPRERWRQGWSSGRTCYAWILDLSDQQGLRQLANQYQYSLLDLAGFDLVPLEWLHLLLQEVGFTDELPDSVADELLTRASAELSQLPAPTLAFHRAVVLPDALALTAEPEARLRHLRGDLQRISAAALPPGHQLLAEPTDADQHVSLANSTTHGPAMVAAATLDATPTQPTTARVHSLSLVRMSRDHGSSEWQTHGRVTLAD